MSTLNFGNLPWGVPQTPIVGVTTTAHVRPLPQLLHPEDPATPLQESGKAVL